jgi:hypothetical protein
MQQLLGRCGTCVGCRKVKRAQVACGRALAAVEGRRCYVYQETRKHVLVHSDADDVRTVWNDTLRDFPCEQPPV